MSNNTLQFERNKRKALLPLDIVYYFIFALVYLYFFVGTTLFQSQYLYVYIQTINCCFRYVTPLVTVLSITHILFYYERLEEKVLPLVIFIVSLFYVYIREFDVDIKTIFITFQLLICSKNKNYKVLLWTSYILGWLTIIVSFISSLTGYLPYYTYENRHGFGSIYPTDLGCHFLVLTITLCIIRCGKLKIRDYIWSAFILVVNYVYMQAKVSFACMFVIMCISFFYQFIYDKINFSRFVKNAFSIIAIICFNFFAVLSIILTCSFDSIADGVINKFLTLKSRLYLGKIAFDNYPITVFGTRIREVGNGGVPAKHSDYFFIDVSYIRLLFFNGIVIFLLVLLIYTLIQRRFIKNKLFYFAALYLVFSIDCIIEHHIIEIAYGLVLMLALFADLPSNKNKIPIR